MEDACLLFDAGLLGWAELLYLSGHGMMKVGWNILGLVEMLRRAVATLGMKKDET